MHWIAQLGFAVLLVAIAAVLGLKPKGGRPVASTRLMTAARVMLVIIALIIAVAALPGASG